jgi:hypothetical protein
VKFHSTKLRAPTAHLWPRSSGSSHLGAPIGFGSADSTGGGDNDRHFCPANSGTTPVLSVFSVPGWILFSLYNLVLTAHGSLYCSECSWLDYSAYSLPSSQLILFAVVSLPGWVLVPLLNLAHNSQLTGFLSFFYGGGAWFACRVGEGPVSRFLSGPPTEQP